MKKKTGLKDEQDIYDSIRKQTDIWINKTSKRFGKVLQKFRRRQMNLMFVTPTKFNFVTIEENYKELKKKEKDDRL